MLIPEETAERRLTHKGTATCRLHVVFARMVKVIVEEKRQGAPVRVGMELHFPKTTWERFEKVEK